MRQALTIVMYHYVRDLARSKYPAIKGLDLPLFAKQLDFLGERYTFVSANDLLAGGGLPPNPVLLTFDDGYADHYTNVFPELARRGISGMFFPVVQASRDMSVLDVNKIHFILASVRDKAVLVRAVNAFVDERCGQYGLKSIAEYEKGMPPSRFDDKETVYIKGMLQRDLPEGLRHALVCELFDQYVSADEGDFAAGLYVHTAQLKEMREAGMTVGAHGVTHRWLATLPPDGQAAELDGSIEYLKEIGVGGDEWTISYPYGNYTADTLALCRAKGFRLGVTTKVALADTNTPLELARLDTNDFPPKSERYRHAGLSI